MGIGDDAAAVLPSGKNKLALLTCDPVMEGIHFDSSATPFQIGWKAMARNLSDIAAMGGVPLHALAAVSLPRRMTVSKALGIYRGLAAAARKYGVSIVGGDTSRSPGGIYVVVMMMGEVARHEIVTRSGAGMGDFVCVTGALGGSIRGKHLRFNPRIHEARFLARRRYPSAMLDLSDGLAGDLQQLAEQSGAGFEIWENALPISSALCSRKLTREQRMEHAMRDGEDYELLFTVPSHRLGRLQAEWKKRFRLRLTPIGVVRSKRFGIQLVNKAGGHRKRSLPPPANDHFRG